MPTERSPSRPTPTRDGSVLVAVVSWNTRDLLDACLTSMAGDPRLRVVVVDNASTDGSADMVRRHHPWARLVASGRNLGFGAAVNLAARTCEGWEWIALANADVALERGAIDALLAAGRRDPRAGGLAPRLILPDGTTQHSVYPFPTVRAAVAFNLGLHRPHFEGHWDSGHEQTVPWAIGAFLLVRREAWTPFDERQFMYAEDLDLGWRLQRAGWHTRYVPSARVRHASAAATLQAWGEARVDRWQDATYAWLERRRGRGARRAVAAVNTAGAGLRWGAYALLSRARPQAYGWRRDRWATWTRRHARGLRIET